MGKGRTMNLHPLLKRQMEKCPDITDDLPAFFDKYEKFIQLVSESYFDFDEERAIMERTIDISSKEYYQKLEEIKNLHASLLSSEKMAGLGQLSAGIAHEINNPLSFIQGNIDILAKYVERIREFHKQGILVLLTAVDATHGECKRLTLELLQQSKDGNLEAIYDDLPSMVEETQEGVQRISKIVRSLLNFSRKSPETGTTSFDLNKSLKDTLTIAYNEIKYYATVQEELGDIPTIRGNADEINQVLLNIIMNAVSAIRSKEVAGLITVRTYLKNDFVYCEIQDNGGGIEKEHLPHIFEPFFTTKPVGSGTGLGLSISYDIVVNKHKGKIDIKTCEGEGTTFILAFPIDPGETLPTLETGGSK